MYTTVYPRALHFGPSIFTLNLYYFPSKLAPEEENQCYKLDIFLNKQKSKSLMLLHFTVNVTEVCY